MDIFLDIFIISVKSSSINLIKSLIEFAFSSIKLLFVKALSISVLLDMSIIFAFVFLYFLSRFFVKIDMVKPTPLPFG